MEKERDREREEGKHVYIYDVCVRRGDGAFAWVVDKLHSAVLPSFFFFPPLLVT